MKTKAKIAKKPAAGGKKAGPAGTQSLATSAQKVGNARLGAQPKKAELPDKLPAFTEGIKNFSANELNEAAMTVLGELTAYKHAEWKKEAHAIASEIFNRSRAIAEAQADIVAATQNLAEAREAEAAAVKVMEEKDHAFRVAKGTKLKTSAQHDFDVAKKSSNAARQARGIAETALNKANENRISVGHFVKAKQGVEMATLAQIVEPHDQFEGHRTGTGYREKFDQSDPKAKTQNMLERWTISKAAVEQLARDPATAGPYLYNLAESSFKKFKRPIRRPEEKIGGNIFSTKEIRRAVMPQLEVGRVDDPAEREAEAVADRVMRMRDGASLAPQAELGQAVPLRRTVAGVGNSAGFPVPAGLEPQVRRATSGGEALPATVRAFFEPRFGEDLSHVRIHRDADAAESASALGAKAYTLGSHIAFSAGRWAPGTDAGDRLVAHELTHVLQHNGSDDPVRRNFLPELTGEGMADYLFSVNAGKHIDIPSKVPDGTNAAAADLKKNVTVRGDPKGDRRLIVAWTIDDGPRGATTEKMKKEGMGGIPQAVWFIQYANIRAADWEKLRNVQSAGGEIGIHSFYKDDDHVPWFPKVKGDPFGKKHIDDDMAERMKKLRDFVGKLKEERLFPKFVRLPGGLDSELQNYARQLGASKADAKKISEAVISGRSVVPFEERFSQITADFIQLKATLNELNLMLWGSGDLEVNTDPHAIGRLEWTAETSGAKRRDDDTTNVVDRSSQTGAVLKTSVAKGEFQGEFERLIKKMKPGDVRGMVVLAHDTLTKPAKYDQDDVRAVKNDRERMEMLCAKEHIILEYRTMSSLFNEVTHKEISTFKVSY